MTSRRPGRIKGQTDAKVSSAQTARIIAELRAEGLLPPLRGTLSGYPLGSDADLRFHRAGGSQVPKVIHKG